MENNTRHNTNSAGETRQFRPDPIIQAKDDSSRSHKGLQPIEIVHGANKPISVADATLLPDQFIGAGGPTQVPLSENIIIQTIFRFKWTILVIFILVSTVTITAVWTQVVPTYHAKAEVRIRPIIPYLVFRTEDNGRIPAYDSFVNTQVAMVESLPVLQRVLDQQKVQETQWYKNPRKPLRQRLLANPVAPPIERLKDSLFIRPRRGTEIVDIVFFDPSVKDAKIIVDTVLEQFIRYTREGSDATKDKLYEQLVREYKSLENEIQGREKITANLCKSIGTGTPQELISSKRIRLDTTQARLSQLRQRIALLEWEKADADDNAEVAVDATDRMERKPKYYLDAEWRERDINVKTVRHQIATGVYGPNHPNMTLAEKNLKFEEELLRQRETQLDEQWRNRPINATGVPVTITGAGSPDYRVEIGSMSPEHQLAQAKQEEKLVLAELEKQQTEFGELFKSAQLLERENNELLRKRNLFSAVQQRLDQKNMERNVSGSINVLTKASGSSQPYNDRRIMFTAMALFMGLGMGCGAALLRASRTQAIYTPKDMPHPMQAPLLGYIPVIRSRRSSNDEVVSTRIESIRFLRTALLSRLNGQDSTSVLVTSAGPGTGKSTFTMMLGKSLAQAGKKVLMVDADFQKMTLTKRFNFPDKSGFMDSLSCRSVDKRNIFPTETSGLSIMPVGKRGDDDVVFEEIANGAFKTCIDELRRQYNIILLDSSPVLMLADATILSSQVDGTIMVERELVSRREDIINALVRLGSIRGRILGTVFIGSSSYEQYRYGYNK